MKIISGTTEFHIDRKSVVAIGKFDGVHLGHQKLLGRMRDWQTFGYLAVVFTFDRPPASIFSPDTDCRELTTLTEKRKLMEQMGADVLVEFPMTAQSAAMGPETFVEEILVKRLNCAVILAGEDISFGHQGRGDRKLLESMAPEMGYELQIVDKLSASEILPDMEGNPPVSSTLIRRLLEEGKMEQAAALCGRPYSVEGSIIHGRHLGGPVLHMPTINVAWPDGKLAPPFGVYDTRTFLEGKYYNSITNVGCKPTVSDEKRVLAETYLYHFDQDVYGENARISFYEYRRPEQKFAGLKELKEQMQHDIRQGEDYWKEKETLL